MFHRYCLYDSYVTPQQFDLCIQFSRCDFWTNSCFHLKETNRTMNDNVHYASISKHCIWWPCYFPVTVFDCSMIIFIKAAGIMFHFIEPPGLIYQRSNSHWYDGKCSFVYTQISWLFIDNFMVFYTYMYYSFENERDNTYLGRAITSLWFRDERNWRSSADIVEKQR